MSTTSRTTELEAVNTMLSCIGEAPFNSLLVSGNEALDNAKRVLDRVSREVQQVGWHFNTETDYPLLRNGSGEISVASNVMQVDTTSDYANYDVTQRGARLYDRKTHSFVFDRDLKATVVFLLPFEDLPQAARGYITIRAARVFQTEMLGSDTQHRFTAEQERLAHRDLQRLEGLTADYNVFNGSNSVAATLRRN